MVMAKATRSGNWRRRSAKGKRESEGWRVIRGMVTLRPMNSPVMMTPSRRCAWMAVTIRRVPFQRLDLASRFRSSMTTAPTLSLISCKGRPERFRELRNSTG